MGQTESSGMMSKGLGKLSDFFYGTKPVETAKINPEQWKELSEKRLQVVQELLQTEKSYVKSLTELNVNWEKPLRAAVDSGKPIIPSADIKAIFSNVESILNLHISLCNSLENRINAWSDKQNLGDIFIENAPALKFYTEYVNNFDNSVKTIAKCLKKPDFLEFVKVATGGISDTYPLSSLLIQPVQRIPRYEMLLSDLVKKTWDSHLDLMHLQAALAKMKEVAQFINEQKRLFEDSQKVLEIQSKIGSKYDLFRKQVVIAVDQGVRVYQNNKSMDKYDEAYLVLVTGKILIWEPTEKTLLRNKEGKVYFCESAAEVVIADNPANFTEECVTISVQKKKEN